MVSRAEVITIATELYQGLIFETSTEFTRQASVINGLNVEIRALIDKVRDDVDTSLKTNKAEGDKMIEDMKAEINTHDLKRIADAKMEVDNQETHNSQFQADIRAQVEVVNKLTTELQTWTTTAEASFTAMATAAQERITATQKSIRDMIDSAKSADEQGGGGKGVFQARAERDRNIYDPRDYKIESIPDSKSLTLALFKKWRHDVELYIDTIGPSWTGVKAVLKQCRHSELTLLPNELSMEPTLKRAAEAAGGVPPFEAAFFDFPSKANHLYKILAPKLNVDLSTEFRNSAADNGFELWRQQED